MKLTPHRTSPLPTRAPTNKQSDNNQTTDGGDSQTMSPPTQWNKSTCPDSVRREYHIEVKHLLLLQLDRGVRRCIVCGVYDHHGNGPQQSRARTPWPTKCHMTSLFHPYCAPPAHRDFSPPLLVARFNPCNGRSPTPRHFPSTY